MTIKPFKEFLTESSDTNKADLSKYVDTVDGKWAFINIHKSKDDPHYVLAWYDGDGVPSDEWILKHLQAVEYFKHQS